MKRSVFFVSTLAIFLLFAFRGQVISAESKPQTPLNQVDVTILHVDKYGVYAPGVVFYWDTGMSRRKLASLNAIAEKLRNRKAVITYSTQTDASKERDLIADIAISSEPVDAVVEKPARQQAENTVAANSPKPADDYYSSGEETSNPDDRAQSDDDQESSGVDSGYAGRPPKPEPVPAEAGNSFSRRKPPEKPEIAGNEDDASGEGRTELPSISRQEVIGFIKYVLSINTKKDLSSVLGVYGDRVDYYTRGVVGRDYIRRDMSYYYRNWDRIENALEGDVVIIVTDERDVRIAKFISLFTVENSRRSVSGRTENVWKIRKTGNSFKIIDIKQSVLQS